MDIQNEKMQTFLGSMEQACVHLEEYQSVTFEAFEKDWKTRAIIERELQQAIQASIDSAMRLIGLKNYKSPDEHAGLFDVLARNKVIPDELSEKMKDLVGFRNILVHEYFQMDLEKVFNHLKNDCRTIREFAKYLVEFLEKE